MAKVLYIKANPKSDQESRTFQISEAFIAAYRQAHPSDEIITLDLYKEMVPPLSTEEVILNNSGTDFAHPFYDYAKQFLAVDKYVFAAPLWNLSVPGILKNYLDRIMVVGITFHYTEEGPVGLCTGKKRSTSPVGAAITPPSHTPTLRWPTGTSGHSWAFSG